MTTLMAGASYGAYYANRHETVSKLLGNNRVVIGVLFLLGIVMCTMSDMGRMIESGEKGVMMVIGAVLGSVALILTVWGLVSGSELAMKWLLVDILLLWFITTVKHAIV